MASLRKPNLFPASREVQRIEDTQKETTMEILELQQHPYKSLSPALASELMARWARPCVEMFEYLAGTHPEELLRLICEETIPPTALTFAAEIAGSIKDSSCVAHVLISLLDHEHPVVREGALYGLERHQTNDAKIAIKRIAEHDPNKEVRAVAREIIEDRETIAK